MSAGTVVEAINNFFKVILKQFPSRKERNRRKLLKRANKRQKAANKRRAEG